MLSKKVSSIGKVDIPAAVDFSSASYDVYAIGVNSSATRVRFPTWNTQETVANWYEGVKVAPGIWKATVVLANHPSGVGNYTTHVYVGDSYWDALGYTTVSQGISIQVPAQVSLAEEQYDILLKM